MKNNNQKIILFLFVFTAIAIVVRLLPHVPNFAPIGALALFSGIYAVRKWQLILPIVAMFVSDMVIGFYDAGTMATVYLGFLVFIVVGRLVRSNKNVLTVLGGTLAGSVFFYLSTNFAVWAFSGMYTRTGSGLISSYVMAVPFFRNSFLGDLFYTGVFVGGYELISYALNSATFRQSRFSKKLGVLTPRR